jgi:hypothetical protein
MQWPQETQLEPPICIPPSQRNAWMLQLPADGEGLIYLDRLARLYALSAENTLAWWRAPFFSTTDNWSFPVLVLL